MKIKFIPKSIIGISIILFVLIVAHIANIANATSGTCSYHNGFDCVAGPDYDGSAICNDGWADSSEDFYTMSGCVPKCSYSELETLNQKYGITQEIDKINVITTELTDLNNQILALDLEEQTKITALDNHGAMTQDFYLGSIARINRDYDTKRAPLISLINAKTNQIKIYQLNINTYTHTVDIECKDLGYKEWQRIQQERLSFKIAAEEELRRLSCPANSAYINSICICNDGYLMKNNQCVTYTKDCQNSFGNNIIGKLGPNNNSSCDCESGYQWNVSRTACVPIQTLATQTSTTIVPTTTTTLPSLKIVQTETTANIESSTINRGEPPNNSLENLVKKTGAENTVQLRFLPRILQSIRNFFLKFFK